MTQRIITDTITKTNVKMLDATIAREGDAAEKSAWRFLRLILLTRTADGELAERLRKEYLREERGQRTTERRRRRATPPRTTRSDRHAFVDMLRGWSREDTEKRAKEADAK